MARNVVRELFTPSGEDLPHGCKLGQDDDGDYWIIPPKRLKIFSTPGEMFLLQANTAEKAEQEARDYLKDF